MGALKMAREHFERAGNGPGALRSMKNGLGAPLESQKWPVAASGSPQVSRQFFWSAQNGSGGPVVGPKLLMGASGAPETA